MLKWGSFIKNKEGEWNGLNDAAIYSFNSNIINSFVREMFQNSIDARDTKLPKDPTTDKIPPLHIKINYKEIEQDEFPDFAGFTDIFRKISTSGPNSKHEKFFKNAFNVLKKNEKVSLFIYEDFNTIGLSGADNDPNSNFNACVVSEGISIKSQSTAGGSFGIGKNSIYGLSKLRTVFYSSMDRKNNYIFQGKSKLASYYDDSRNTRDNKIYCGAGENFSSVRGLNNMPTKDQSLFYRDRPGLSQYAMFPVEHEEWPKEFVKAILRNYWMLLEKNELIVELLKQDQLIYRLSKENLEDLLLEFFNPSNYEPSTVEPIGNPYEYYHCFKHGNCIDIEDFLHLGKVRFYYREIDNKTTNAIAYLRNDMVVYANPVWGYGSIGYCGIFLCDDNKGNEILSAMEPPTHDSFSPERLEEKYKNLSAKDGVKILENIKNLIKQGLQEIKDKYTQPAEDIGWLDNLLSSLTGSASKGKGDRKNEKATEETTEKIGENVQKTLSFRSQERNTVVNDKTGEVEGSGAGNKRKREPGPGPKPGSNPGSNPGPQPGAQSLKKTKINSRIFKTPHRKLINGIIHNNYRIYLDSNKEVDSTDIIINQQGDTGSVTMFEVGEAAVIGGKNLKFTEERNSNNEIIGFRIKDINIPTILQVYVNEPYKSSFRIINS